MNDPEPHKNEQQPTDDRADGQHDAVRTLVEQGGFKVVEPETEPSSGDN